MKNEVKYTKEFKVEAVRLLEEGEKTATDLANELGVRRTLLYRWRDQLKERGQDYFKQGPGRPKKGQESELVRLQRELAAVKEERDILKKAAAYFAKDLR